jgi:hypothetical protein
MNLRRIIESLQSPSRLWRRSEILTRPCPVPPCAGVYAWYFRDLSDVVSISGCHSHKEHSLLYLGIAPSSCRSMATLLTRIPTHLRGNASGSTLRLTLGCLLSERLGLTLRKTGRTGRLTFGEGERILSSWLDANAAVVWIKHGDPWRFESRLIRELGLPLNIEHNEHHPFYKHLRQIRQARRDAARSRAKETDVQPHAAADAPQAAGR